MSGYVVYLENVEMTSWVCCVCYTRNNRRWTDKACLGGKDPCDHVKCDGCMEPSLLMERSTKYDVRSSGLTPDVAEPLVKSSGVRQVSKIIAARKEAESNAAAAAAASAAGKKGESSSEPVKSQSKAAGKKDDNSIGPVKTQSKPAGKKRESRAGGVSKQNDNFKELLDYEGNSKDEADTTRKDSVQVTDP